MHWFLVSIGNYSGYCFFNDCEVQKHYTHIYIHYKDIEAKQ